MIPQRFSACPDLAFLVLDNYWAARAADRAILMLARLPALQILVGHVPQEKGLVLVQGQTPRRRRPAPTTRVKRLQRGFSFLTPYGCLPSTDFLVKATAHAETPTANQQPEGSHQRRRSCQRALA